MNTDHLVWHTNRILFEIGPLQIRWYGLLFALGFLIGYYIVAAMFRRRGHSRPDLDALLLTMMLSTIIGARLGHVLFYNPGYYLSNPLQILFVWKGGLASHGGALGITAGIYLFSRKRPNLSFLHVLDMVAVPTALAGAFIRTGNFFNAEILGTPSDLPWAVVFASYDTVARHPAMLYEAAAYLLIFAVLLVLWRKTNAMEKPGRLLGVFLTLVFSARIGLETFKMQQAAFDLPLGLSMGQLLSIPAVAIGLHLIHRSRKSSAASTS